MSTRITPKAIAFYLPQYHPIPENDRWWGKGFTEWRNVVKARPLFKEHYQPHLPADLGFYDLRVPETRQAQADLAREYGIHGFCYYHYWFKGKRLLQRPLDEVLSSGEPDFPFCLCWANENWTRRWDGHAEAVLLRQEYDDEDDGHHIRWLARVFADKRYVRYQDKPVFLVYRASSLPNPLRTTTIWRTQARRLGIGELFLLRVESTADDKVDPAACGFDAAVEFQPDWESLPARIQPSTSDRLLRKLGLSGNNYRDHAVVEYASVVQRMIEKPEPSYRRFPCVTPSWDNTARRERGGIILTRSNPETYEHWLRLAIKKEITANGGEPLVFINAWNEWAEGNHLEPCQKWGRAYLEATKRAISSNGHVRS